MQTTLEQLSADDYVRRIDRILLITVTITLVLAVELIFQIT